MLRAILNSNRRSLRLSHRGLSPLFFSTNKTRQQSSDRFLQPDRQYREDSIPKQSDVVIVGGGVVGWATAYWIRCISQTTVTVIERDPSLARASSLLSLGTLRTQLSEVENIQMSLYASEFLREVGEYLRTSVEDIVSVNFCPHGHLLLADEAGSEILKANNQLQVALDVKCNTMSPAEVQKRWAWLNTSDISLASIGERGEGWFDSWLLIRHLRNKAHIFGVNFVVGEVIGFTYHRDAASTHFYDRPNRAPVSGPILNEVKVKTQNGDTQKIAFHTVVNAAGPWATDILEMALAESNEDILPFPVEKRKQNVFIVRPDYASHTSDLPGLDCPILLDYTGLFLQRQGLSGDFAVCMNPNRKLTKPPKASEDDFLVDYSEFNEEIQPRLASRIPNMATAQIKSAWAYTNDYNSVDQSLIVGPHPYLCNMLLANGSTGLATQHSIAIGRALAEYVHYRHYKTIDLSRFSFDRFYMNLPVVERKIF